MNRSMGKFLGACLVGFCTASSGYAQADWSLHGEYGFFDVDGYDDDGTMLVIGGGYQVWRNTSVKFDYGLTVSDAETPATAAGGTAELDLTQIRFYVENNLPFGDTGFGAHFRYGLVRLDADVSVSGNGLTSDQGEADTTNVHFGGGLHWSPTPGHRLSFNLDLPDSDITTMAAGYQVRF